MAAINLLIHDLNHSGTSHAAIVLANKLQNYKRKVKIIIVGQNKNCPFDLSKNIELTFLKIKRPQSFIEKLLYIPKSILALKKYIHTQNPENFIIYGKEFACICLLLRIFLNKNFKVIVINSTYISGQLKYMKGFASRIIHKLIYMSLLPKANHIIAICQEMVDDLVKNYHIPNNKITTIYPPLAEKFFNTTLISTSKNSQEILFVGRLDKYKAPDKLIKVFANIAKENKNALLRIIGDGPLRGDLNLLAQNLSIKEKVIFQDPQKDTLPYMQKAKLLVLTSNFEGFGQVLAESIACGTPIVSFNCPTGPSEIVQNRINGYIVPSGNNEILEEKIKTTLNKDWNKAKIAKTAQKFNPNMVLEKYIKVIDKTFKI